MTKLKLLQSQIQIFKDLDVFDQVEDILDEYSEKYAKLKLVELIYKTRQDLQAQVFDIIHKSEHLNQYKLTTIDPVQLQKSLLKMVKNNCKTAIIEISSQGLEQNRHFGLGKFDVVTFLNLYPEHIDAHGSFENYKNCKLKLFKVVKKNGIAVVNGDDKNSDDFLNLLPKECGHVIVHRDKDYVISKYSGSIYKNFEVKNLLNFETKVLINSHLIADFEISNAMIAARLTDKFLEKNHSRCFDYKILSGDYFGIPGRLEWVVQDNQIVFKSTNELTKVDQTD